jgi:hypothetical protein
LRIDKNDSIDDASFKKLDNQDNAIIGLGITCSCRSNYNINPKEKIMMKKKLSKYRIMNGRQD